MARFTVLLYREEDGYSAIVPVLNVASQGRTVEEALAMAHEATELQVKWLAEHNEPILEEEEPPIVAAVNIDIPVVAPAYLLTYTRQPQRLTRRSDATAVPAR